MKPAHLTLRLVLFLLLGWASLGPGTPAAQAAGVSPAAHHGPATSVSLPANKLFDYIRGNRARMVQIATIGLVIGLVILMTATRKH
jgi:hypothetical protein